jgi:hypothetical protein
VVRVHRVLRAEGRPRQAAPAAGLRFQARAVNVGIPVVPRAVPANLAGGAENAGQRAIARTSTMTATSPMSGDAADGEDGVAEVSQAPRRGDAYRPADRPTSGRGVGNVGAGVVLRLVSRNSAPWRVLALQRRRGHGGVHRGVFAGCRRTGVPDGLRHLHDRRGPADGAGAQVPTDLQSIIERDASASVAARRAQQHEPEGLQPRQVDRYGRTTTKDVAPAGPAKRPPTANSAGLPGKALHVERTPAPSKASRKTPTSGTTMAAQPREGTGSRLGGRRGRSRFAASVCSGTMPCSRKQ